jgi:hypothetical protein
VARRRGDFVKIIGVFALLLVVVAAAPAAAGIQNVQSALATEVSDGVSGNVSGSLDWRTGNISFLSMAASSAVRVRDGKNLLIGLVRLERKSSADDLIFGRTFEHIRYRYLLEKWLLLEAFAQHEYDAKKRLNIRAIGGFGPKADIVEGKNYGVGIGAAYLFELEQLSVEDGVADSGTNDTAHRLSSYLVGFYGYTDRLQLVETFYAQPRLTDLADTRLLSESSLVVKATDKLSVATSFTIAFDNRPPETVEKTDTALITTMTYEWGGK